ncbi:MAG: hypothetical protein RR619_12170, partial [Raoultibacter sp.]
NASKDCITNPSASDGAVAVEKTAPSAARKPVCPQCRVMITPNSNGAFACPTHGEVSPDYEDWGHDA